ncbi:hypothetical protein GN958_ATG13509 [Phytophthora infestans]|uniref:Transmembrane protein n=1 Tax=Phytophthora infestans TaxID=4787 RepID=A0A8S9UCS5_PHYIN|nr:hypothetical protein GN958_ATG13507 [Phytophthora infestans]KAF4137299.1 hypothetical protein GN958_ATG13509 [Phytophthora infestans]
MVVELSSTDAETQTLTSQRRRPAIGHGALREDDSHRTLRSPLLASSCATNRSPTGSIASQTLSAGSAPSTFLRLRHRHYANFRELRGKISRVPRFWLWPRFLYNSFFAKRLVFAGFLVSVALAWGVSMYNIKILQWLADFKASNPEDFEHCRMTVIFSGLIYHMLPVAVLLFLPGSGLRSFEPFKREVLEPKSATATWTNADRGDAAVDLEKGERGSTSIPKIRRRLVFQLCELLAVCALVFDAALVFYFPVVLFTGAIYACDSYAMHLFTVGGAVCYVGLFIVIYYFARYREHIKMQLGAFTESDQTKDIRKHDLDLSQDKTIRCCLLYGLVCTTLHAEETFQKCEQSLTALEREDSPNLAISRSCSSTFRAELRSALFQAAVLPLTPFALALPTRRYSTTLPRRRRCCNSLYTAIILLLLVFVVL